MSTAITVEQFANQLEHPKSTSRLEKYLGKDTPVDAFTSVVMRAVQENPELLEADQKSLFFACQKAAQDGLMPDGKEGYLGVYNTNIGTAQHPQWIKKVQWNPMIEGMRKVLGKHNISLRAELVYEKDEFFYDKGDNPKLVHRADVFSTNRGEMIGGYAIATDIVSGEILGREAMNVPELEKVRGASKNPNGAVWKKWPEMMYRKAPARRLFSQVPRISKILKGILESDNETFDLNKETEVTQPAKDVQAAVRLAAPNPNTKVQPVKAEPEAKAIPIAEATTAEPGWPQEEVPQEESNWTDEVPAAVGAQVPDF